MKSLIQKWKEQLLIPTIELPEAALLRFEVMKANQKYTLPSEKRTAMAKVAGQIIMATALGFKVAHAEVFQNTENGAWDCSIDLNLPAIQLPDDISEEDGLLRVLKVALYFISGHAGELFDGVASTESSLFDRFRCEYLCGYLDKYTSLPSETIFHRVSTLVSSVMVRNFGVFAGVLLHLENRDAIVEKDLSLCLPAVEVEDLNGFLRGLQ